MSEAGSMAEVIALENEIADALPRADAAAGDDASKRATVALAHDLLCNGLAGPGSRLGQLRTVAAEFRRFA